MRRLFTIAALSVLSINLAAQDVAIRNVSVVDVNTGKLLPAYAIAITGGKISWAGPDKKLKVSATTKMIDGAGKFLLPGLIDTHIHFFQSGSLYTRPDVADFNHVTPYAKERADGWNNAADYLERYLRLGITTVMDVGGPMSNFSVRDSVSKTITSPNVLVTGPLFSIVDRKKLELNDAPIIKITSIAEADELFAKMLPKKPDFIKIWYIANSQNPADKSYPIVKHVADVSAKNNLKLAVHATQLATARLAVEAGATILVHSVEDEVVPDDFIKLLKSKKVTYIPTMIVGVKYAKAFSGKLDNHPQDLAWANPFAYGSMTDIESMDTASLPAGVRAMRKTGVPKRYARTDSIMKINLRKLFSAGVNVATGTDAGNIGTFHASSYIQELEGMQKAGLSNAEILRASTINAAAGFGISNKVGSIEKDKQADLVLLNSNPLLSLANLNDINSVLKDGKVIEPDSLVSESPEEIVQRQLNAYNARNIEAFIATYSKDIEIFDSEGKLLMKGHDDMRKRYAFFETVANLYCEIEQRIVISNTVIDKEKVRSGNNVRYAVAVYQVENGKIRKVTFYR